MSWWLIGALAVGTFGFRLTGPLLRSRITVPPRLIRVLGLGATALLISLAVTQTLYADGAFAGWARVLGVGVGALLIWRRMPFAVVVVGAAGAAALLRLAGVA